MKRVLSLTLLVAFLFVSVMASAFLCTYTNTVKAQGSVVESQIVVEETISLEQYAENSSSSTQTSTSADDEQNDNTKMVMYLLILINVILVFLTLLNIFLALGSKVVKKKEKKELSAEDIAQAVLTAQAEKEEGKKELTAEDIAQEVIKAQEEKEADKKELTAEDVEEIVKNAIEKVFAEKTILLSPVVDEEAVTEEVEEIEEVEEVEDGEEDEAEEDGELEEGQDGELDPFGHLKNKRSKTFEERLAEADDQTKANYEVLKAEFDSYKKVNARISKKCESFRFGRTLVSKIIIRGKSLKVFLPLNVADYEETKYHQKDAGDKKAYQEVPFKISVRSPRSVKKAIELIGEVANKLELVKKQ